MNMASSPATAPANSCRSSCRRSRIGSRRSDLEVEPQGRSSKLNRPHFLEFVAARVAEVSQQINRAIDDHLAQFEEALVGLQIDVQDFSDNIVGTLDHRL